MNNPLRPSLSGTVTTLLLVACATAASAQLRIVSYNTHHEPYTPQDPDWITIIDAMAAEEVAGIAKPPAIFALTELGTTRDPNSNPPSGSWIESLVEQRYGRTYNRVQIHAGSYEDYAFIYDPSQVELLATATAQAGYRPAHYGRFRPVGYGPDAEFHIYNVHLKAFPGFENTRFSDMSTVIFNHATQLPDDASVIFLGDFNTTTTGSEGVYDLMTADGWQIHQAFDPHAAETAPAYYGSGIQGQIGSGPPAAYCTYSSSNAWSRIDFQFPSLELGDGEGVDLVPGSYRVFGNVGGFPDPIQLWFASDHFPVNADYQIPAKLGVDASGFPSAFVVGAAATFDVTISNDADVVAVAGADELEYELTTSGAVSGSATGVDYALDGGNDHPVTFDTSAAGVYSGTIAVTTDSPAAANPNFTQNVMFLVYDRAEGSFAADADQDTLSLDLGAFVPGSGVQEVTFSIYNLEGFPGGTATLEIESVGGSGDTTALTTDVAPTSISAGSGKSFKAQIDTDALQGVFTATYTFTVADDDTLYGAGPGTPLELQLNGYVAVDGDLDLNQVVDDADVALMGTSFGASPATWVDGDFNGDSLVDDTDLGILGSNWGPVE